MNQLLNDFRVRVIIVLLSIVLYPSLPDNWGWSLGFATGIFYGRPEKRTNAA